MTDLSPLEAARIAQGVYRLREHSIPELDRLHQELGSEDQFSVGVDASGHVSGRRFTGRSGGLVAFKSVTGFGYLAAGKGARQGEVLVATRGTAIGVDWLTNLNIAMQRGPSGHLVHAGFNDVWKSFSSVLGEFMRGRNPSVIHCVGHSLGGALATLNADHFSSARMGEVRLYTFGSPRVGSARFASHLSQRVGDGHIHRVFHRADPVPMIPIFPFAHVPTASPACPLTGGDRGPISVGAHSMAESYIPGVGDAGWLALERASGSAGDLDARSWLDQVADGGGVILPFGARALQMIGKALVWVLKQVRSLLLGTVGLALTAGMTVLDQLAWLLSRGAQLTLDMSRYVGTVIASIFRFMGRAAITGASLTMQFIRWVLDLLFGTLSRVAGAALSHLG